MSQFNNNSDKSISDLKRRNAAAFELLSNESKGIYLIIKKKYLKYFNRI